MSDIKAHIEKLEQAAAEHELLGALAIEAKIRDANRRRAHDLREEAFKMKNEFPKSNPAQIAPRDTQYA
jgi:hypothetical protein